MGTPVMRKKLTVIYKKKSRRGNSMRYSTATPDETANGIPMKAQVPRKTCTVGSIVPKWPISKDPFEDTEEMTRMLTRRVSRHIASTPINKEAHPQHV